MAGFEPTTFCPPDRRATKLRHIPFELGIKESNLNLLGQSQARFRYTNPQYESRRRESNPRPPSYQDGALPN